MFVPRWLWLRDGASQDRDRRRRMGDGHSFCRLIDGKVVLVDSGVPWLISCWCCMFVVSTASSLQRGKAGGWGRRLGLGVGGWGFWILFFSLSLFSLSSSWWVIRGHQLSSGSSAWSLHLDPSMFFNFNYTDALRRSLTLALTIQLTTMFLAQFLAFPHTD